MHMQGDPSTMQQRPHYDDVFAELDAFFDERIAACVDAGIDASRLVIDPGFGFGKTLEHNVALLKGLAGFRRFGPVLAGLSRKSMLGALLGGAPVDQRLYAGLAAATISVINGASIVRVHDVKATTDALADCHCRAAARQSGEVSVTRKYFGTDGVRGKVGETPITPSLRSSWVGPPVRRWHAMASPGW
jgi:dihydropteroate synthase